jgi:DNA-binding NarL/FixJ family response regulator
MTVDASADVSVVDACDRRGAILDALYSGHKDAAAARHLGISIRQYRRHVAEIMRDIGAASRFQAGARAVQLGLLGGAGQPVMPPSTANTPPVT